MKFNDPWIDPRVANVRSADAQAYLLSRGWSRMACDQSQLLPFTGPDSSEESPVVWVPIQEQAKDYPQRIIELITDLALAEDRYAVEVLDNILQVNAAPPLPGNGFNVSQPVENKVR